MSKVIHTSSPELEQSIGLYPVVDKAEWLNVLLPLGVSSIQLRIKDKPIEWAEAQIEQAVEINAKYNAKLFINDYWELAIEKGAYGVHLGQEDLDDADITAIKKAGLRLGISTHIDYEIERALSVKPSYIALGPIYPTTTKDMPWDPQGLVKLKSLVATTDLPVVAIGGINLDRIQGVFDTGCDGIAVLSAITQAHDPNSITLKLLATFNNQGSNA
jgi:thiamine-phosphate pyrophosphorylase